MTAEQEWQFEVWKRWLRISRRRATAHVSGDIILRTAELPSMADAVDEFEKEKHKPTLFQVLWS